MLVDLHCHSTRSDGSLTPSELAERAAARGLRLFCLTDHDTLAGVEEVRAELALRSPDTQVLTGVELSCREYDRTVHLLLYGVQEGRAREELDDQLARLRESRRERLRLICARLETLGVTIDPDRLLAESDRHGSTPGRPDVARALVQVGVCSSQREAFERFLHDGGPADVAVDRVGVSDALRMAREAGAKVSLAHPHTLRSYSLVEDLFGRYQRLGLEGVEAWYGLYGPAQREPWLRLGRRRGLVFTGGSDFHGEAVPRVTQLGVDLPAPHAQRVLEWLELTPVQDGAPHDRLAAAGGVA